VLRRAGLRFETFVVFVEGQGCLCNCIGARFQNELSVNRVLAYMSSPSCYLNTKNGFPTNVICGERVALIGLELKGQGWGKKSNTILRISNRNSS
jgi:hypothetical protein